MEIEEFRNQMKTYAGSMLLSSSWLSSYVWGEAMRFMLRAGETGDDEVQKELALAKERLLGGKRREWLFGFMESSMKDVFDEH